MINILLSKSTYALKKRYIEHQINHWFLALDILEYLEKYQEYEKWRTLRERLKRRK